MLLYSNFVFVRQNINKIFFSEKTIPIVTNSTIEKENSIL